LLVTSSAYGGTVLYVDDDAAEGGDGSSWGTAYRFLQDALTAGPEATEIRVAQGLYHPDRSEANPTGTGDRLAAFALASGRAIRGGYAGVGAKDPDERDPDVFESVLTGDLLGDDGPEFANNSDNSHRVVSARMVDDTAVLDGFTITAGNANEIHGLDNGAGLEVVDGSPLVVDCLFVANSAGSNGGGMYARGGSPTVTDCRFVGNRSGFGGALKIELGSMTVEHCLFRGNFALEGGAFQISDADAILVGCAFVENEAEVAGAIGVEGGNASITCCTFAANFAETLGALSVVIADVAMTNTIVWGSTSLDDAQIGVSLFAGLTVAYCDVEGGADAIPVDDTSSLTWLDGNVDADPLYVDPEASDYRLSAESPCLDAADNTAIPPEAVRDLDGSPRFIDDPTAPDTGLGDCPIADMGAYERQDGAPDCCPADIDGSGEVDTGDLLAVLAAWDESGGPADIDGSGVVDVGDLLIVLAEWGPCAP
jgi:hypothetical protein